MTTKRAGSPYDLCNFVFADGRSCCMPAIPSLNGYCRSHGTVLKPRPADETNADLLQEIGLFNDDPPSEEDVHRAMARVFRALAANRISTRRADLCALSVSAVSPSFLLRFCSSAAPTSSAFSYKLIAADCCLPLTPIIPTHTRPPGGGAIPVHRSDQTFPGGGGKEKGRPAE